MGKRILLLIGAISMLLFLETSIPYLYAEHKTPPGSKFLGQIIYTADQNMYFSFIRQARDGQFVFNNKLTGIPNGPAFVNIEFWLIGAIQRVTGISENAVYYVWRYLGILLLTIGFYLLATLFLPSPRRRVGALAVFLFTGGFGFVFALLNYAHIISLDTLHLGMFDLRYGILPFQQMTTNPHFSFPHGLILIAYSLFLLGEQKNKTSYYLLCGLVFDIIGMVRPYDIMPPFFIFPLFVLVMNMGQKPNWRLLAKKMLPLLMILPVLLYNVWLFKVNEIFKYWSSQGHNAGDLPAMWLHYLSYGVISILALVRVAQAKTNPLGKNGTFLVLWFVSTFIIIQLGRYFPVIGWSPQIGVYLAVPLTLLAFSVQYPKRRSVYYGIVACITLSVVISNASIIWYYTKNFSDRDKSATFYSPKYETEALKWLNDNTKKGDVVMATLTTSQRIAKYTSASVVAAHYSVTPRFEETIADEIRILSNPVLDEKQRPLLQKLHVTYIYLGPEERVISNIKADTSAYLTHVYDNEEVAIYRVSAF